MRSCWQQQIFSEEHQSVSSGQKKGKKTEVCFVKTSRHIHLQISAMAEVKQIE